MERDPATYCITSLKPLTDIFAIVRDQSDPQLFTIELVRGPPRHYNSTERDSLIASLLDAVRASGNRDVCVKMSRTRRGLRVGPFARPVEEEVEGQHIRWLQAPPPGLAFCDVLERFNTNISYSGTSCFLVLYCLRVLPPPLNPRALPVASRRCAARGVLRRPVRAEQREADRAGGGRRHRLAALLRAD